MNTQNYDDTEIDKMIKFINFNKNIIEKKNNFFLFTKLTRTILIEIKIVNC